jgi:hypothetical protein
MLIIGVSSAQQMTSFTRNKLVIVGGRFTNPPTQTTDPITLPYLDRKIIERTCTLLYTYSRFHVACNWLSFTKHVLAQKHPSKITATPHHSYLQNNNPSTCNEQARFKHVTQVFKYALSLEFGTQNGDPRLKHYNAYRPSRLRITVPNITSPLLTKSTVLTLSKRIIIIQIPQDTHLFNSFN